MNESEYLRQQLATERAHLREILQAVRAGTAGVGNARPVADYIDWASHRLVAQLSAHCVALQSGSGTAAETRAQLNKVSGAMSAATATAPHGVAEPLLALLDAWSDSLDSLAGHTLRAAHWRQAAQLNADTILAERRLHAAARAAAGLIK
jgi:hypothetical protein